MSLRTHIPEFEIAVRLIIAAVLAAVIGLDRELTNRPAGLRTHMLVSVTAAMFTILTFEIHARIAIQNSDPIRIIEAVTAGVAFLAGGAIIRGREGVVGLTTGAGMWLAGSIGVACGAGYYTIAAMGAVLAFVIIVIIRLFEDKPDETGRPSE